jgi:hypothetical protein
MDAAQLIDRQCNLAEMTAPFHQLEGLPGNDRSS